MNKYKLSICIPTYNFGNFIGKTLDSIVCQLNDDVEVLVVDGASTDSTSDIVKKYADTWPHVRYYLLGERGGIDRDMSKSVELAKGEYCWIFSADDLMLPGAINRVLKEIEENIDICLCRHKNCTFEMQELGDHAVLNIFSDRDFVITTLEERQRYFSLAVTTEAFFSFMGGIIIKKEKWMSKPLNEKFVGSCWAHVARIFELMKEGLSIRYIVEPLLSKRGGNDSFRENGVVQRYKLAINGYNKIANHYFGQNSMEAYHIRRVLRNEFTIKHFIYVKLLCHQKPEIEDKSIFDAVVKEACVDNTINNITARIIYSLTPYWVCRLAWLIYNFTDRLPGKRSRLAGRN